MKQRHDLFDLRLENVMRNVPSSDLATNDQIHSADSPTHQNVHPEELIETDSVESTRRIETDGGVKETSVTTASNSPNMCCKVDSTSKMGGGGESVPSLRIDVAFSQDILMFLLWIRGLGFERALALAETFPSPWPETLSAFRVACVSSGRGVVFGWQEDSKTISMR
jgi:hypothetical protein